MTNARRIQNFFFTNEPAMVLDETIQVLYFTFGINGVERRRDTLITKQIVADK